MKLTKLTRFSSTVRHQQNYFTNKLRSTLPDTLQLKFD